MDLSETYSINGPDVVAEDFNGQVVILNLASGHYYSLRGIASSIWAHLVEGHRPASILASMGEHRQEIVPESAQFLDRLLELGLIVPRSGMAASAGILAAAWQGEPPGIDEYDDLAELIFNDPIHDVDEQAGWPMPRRDH